jgi:hypothetical protein
MYLIIIIKLNMGRMTGIQSPVVEKIILFPTKVRPYYYTAETLRSESTQPVRLT